MIKVENVGDKGIVSFYSTNVRCGYKVETKNVIEAANYTDGCILTLISSDYSQINLISDYRFSNLSDLSIQNYNMKLGNNIQLVEHPHTARVTADATYSQLFYYVLYLARFDHSSRVLPSLSSTEIGIFLESIAKDVMRTSNKLVFYYISLINHFYIDIYRRGLDYFISEEFDALNRLWSPQVDPLTYFECAVLFSISSKAFIALGVYNYGYHEIASVVMKHTFTYYVHSGNKGLSTFMYSVSNSIYNLLAITGPLIDYFSSIQGGYELNNILHYAIEKIDPLMNRILYTDEINGNPPLLFSVIEWTACLFTRNVHADYLLELWLQLLRKPTVNTLMKMCADLICARYNELLGAIGLKSAAEFAGEDVFMMVYKIRGLKF